MKIQSAKKIAFQISARGERNQNINVLAGRLDITQRIRNNPNCMDDILGKFMTPILSMSEKEISQIRLGISNFDGAISKEGKIEKSDITIKKRKKFWSDTENESLTKMLKDGKSYHECAELLVGRTVSQVRDHVRVLVKKDPTISPFMSKKFVTYTTRALEGTDADSLDDDEWIPETQTSRKRMMFLDPEHLNKRR